MEKRQNRIQFYNMTKAIAIFIGLATLSIAVANEELRTEGRFFFPSDPFTIMEAEAADLKKGPGIELDHVKHNMPGFWLAYKRLDFNQPATSIELNGAAPNE